MSMGGLMGGPGGDGGGCAFGHGGPDNSASWSMAWSSEKDWNKILARDPRFVIAGAVVVFLLMISLPWVLDCLQDQAIVAERRKQGIVEDTAPAPESSGPSPAALMFLTNPQAIDPTKLLGGGTPQEAARDAAADEAAAEAPDADADAAPDADADAAALPQTAEETAAPHGFASAAAVAFGKPRGPEPAPEQAQHYSSTNNFVPQNVWASPATPAQPHSAEEAAARGMVSSMSSAGISQLQGMQSMQQLQAYGRHPHSNARLIEGTSVGSDGTLVRKARVFVSR